MGLFGRRNDWNVIAIIFERKDLYQINGNRGRGSLAKKLRDGARLHTRTIFWAVFDQGGAFLEGEPGPGKTLISSESLSKLTRELVKIASVRNVLARLETGDSDKVAKPLRWDGYPGSAGPA